MNAASSEVIRCEVFFAGAPQNEFVLSTRQLAGTRTRLLVVGVLKQAGLKMFVVWLNS